ncbi:MAG: class I SAM-dependent methyltransferase [Microcoleaceae cyanobacterium]
MTDPDSITSWYDQLSETYTAEQRKNWYSEAAVAYNRVRPRYPEEMINQVLEQIQLPPTANILELGCGPGIATVEFAKRGFSLVCLEPSQAASQLAQQNCLQYPNVKIIQTTFEDWELPSQQFHAVLAATSFHWISPETRCLKVAKVLKENGYLILLWNTPPQPSYEIHQELQPVYQVYAPELAEYQSHKTHQQNLNAIVKTVIDSDLFDSLVQQSCICETSYNIEDYIALLSTLSPYIKLEHKQRNSLFTNLINMLEKISNNYPICLSYLSAFHLLHKN